MIQDATLDAMIDNNLSAVEMKVWLRLVRIRQYTSNTVRVTRARLAEVIGCTVKAVGRALNRLREVGLVSWEGQHRRASKYTVHGLRQKDTRAAKGHSGPSVKGHSCPPVQGHSGPSISHDVPIPTIREVGPTGSNPHPAREERKAEKDIPFDDLIADPHEERRRRSVEHGRALAEAGTADAAGRLPAEASVGDVREEVRRRQNGGDTVAELLDGFLLPARPIEVIYDPERAAPYLGDQGRPFSSQGAVPEPFRRALGVGDTDDGENYATSVWDRVRQAAAWEELTPRVVAAAVAYWGTADVLMERQASAPGLAWSSAADLMVLEIWCQVKAQRMSIRSVCSGEDRVKA